eukprot:COSAG06_NODE_2497_length_6757_cov_80.480625_4_plen_190_part_00
MSFAYVVIWPVVMSIIAGWVNTLFETEIVTIDLTSDLLKHEGGDLEEEIIAGMGVTYPYSWTADAGASADLDATTFLGTLAGTEVAGGDVSTAMADAIASASGPYLPGAFDLAATATDNIQTTLYYNQSVAYSARVAVEQLYVGFVVSSGSSDSAAATAVEVSYTQLPNALMQNSFSVGGVQYLLRTLF